MVVGAAGTIGRAVVERVPEKQSGEVVQVVR